MVCINLYTCIIYNGPCLVNISIVNIIDWYTKGAHFSWEWKVTWDEKRTQKPIKALVMLIIIWDNNRLLCNGL